MKLLWRKCSAAKLRLHVLLVSIANNNKIKERSFEHPQLNSSLKSNGHAIADLTFVLQYYWWNFDELLTAFSLFSLFVCVNQHFISYGRCFRAENFCQTIVDLLTHTNLNWLINIVAWLARVYVFFYLIHNYCWCGVVWWCFRLKDHQSSPRWASRVDNAKIHRHLITVSISVYDISPMS